MADKTTEQEPSIEEILASIRQIISDDDGGDSAASAPASAPEPEPAPAPAPAAAASPKTGPVEVKAAGADVLDLTEVVAKPPRIEIDMQEAEDEPEDIAAPPEEPVSPPPAPIIAEPEPEPEPVAMPESRPDEKRAPVASAAETILTNQASRAAIEGFTKLTNQMAIDRQSRSGVTLEDIVREMVRPMLREWLDANLPGLIEKLVQKELDRLAQKALDE